MRRSILLAIPFTLLLSAASAQTVIVNRPPTPEGSRGGEVRVQVSMNFFVPGAVNASDESFDAQERVRKSMYERANKECEVLKAALASECRLEAININVNRQYGQQMEGFNANSNMTYKVTLK